MKIYLLQNKAHPSDKCLKAALDSLSMEFKILTLPADHGDITHVMSDLQGGVIMLPGIWTDLFCVKVIEETALLSTPFETVIVAPEPDLSNLVVAFNEGLSGYLKLPVTEERLRQVISRARARFEKRLLQIEAERRFSDLAAQSIPFNRSKAMTVRNQYLGKAFIDFAKRRGPVFEGTIEVLLVSSSSLQQKQLEELLKASGLSTTTSGNIEEAIQGLEEKDYRVVIADGILPDGDATVLAGRVRKIAKKMPYMIVWSSSPEKAETLLRPENHIDEVLLKPGPDIGIESVLPSLIAAIYQA